MKRLTVFLMVLALLCPAGWAESAVGMVNPWCETTQEELLETLGVTFGVPEGAEEIVYRMMEEEGVAEMQFAWQGTEYVARIRSAEAFEDISGFFYDWDSEETCEIGWCEGQLLNAQTDEGGVWLCLWYDAAPGLMYSLGTHGSVKAQPELLSLAEEVYVPAQGDVE